MKHFWLILLLSQVLTASAAEWVRVRTAGEGDQYYYDRTKLFINGEEITYWKKALFKAPQPAKGQLASSGLYRERIHCAEHTLKLISYLLYAADGSTIEYVANHEGEAAPIIPDTLGDVFEKVACDLVRLKLEAERKKTAEQSKRLEVGKNIVAPPPSPAPDNLDNPKKEGMAGTPMQGEAPADAGPRVAE